jgi:hypothetical protein
MLKSEFKTLLNARETLLNIYFPACTYSGRFGQNTRVNGMCPNISVLANIMIIKFGIYLEFAVCKN